MYTTSIYLNIYTCISCRYESRALVKKGFLRSRASFQTKGTEDFFTFQTRGLVQKGFLRLRAIARLQTDKLTIATRHFKVGHGSQELIFGSQMLWHGYPIF